ncbi:hypothetical protein BDV95DRAFT_86800 [Massariosphaeria phaeospora]|uniref:Uncharacterized protein n=1 Tax=Massariosphaeria phaeospora TaxID=100035 RepID=A0A7C8I5H1_9PLEO|nr:hypothetical protein BDV95DRAFT_86800 [Massariosphaeria phaeospora]
MMVAADGALARWVEAYCQKVTDLQLQRGRVWLSRPRSPLLCSGHWPDEVRCQSLPRAQAMVDWESES